MKSQALLALLLTSNSGLRSRVWLQDKLWSDRASEQGAASLRQALREIRRTFEEHRDLIRADRRVVSLDLDRVELASCDEEDCGEFLEGIDVRDPEFESWLVARRARPSPIASPAVKTASPSHALSAVLVRGLSEARSPAGTAETLFADLVARSLRELASFDVYRRQPHPVPERLLLVSILAFHAPNQRLGLRVSVEDVASQKEIWSETAVSESRDAGVMEDLVFLSLSNAIAGAVLYHAVTRPARPQSCIDANLLTSLAIQRIFTMRREDLNEADLFLRRAFEIDRRGAALAWRAQLLANKFVERIVGDPKALTEEAEECAAYALEFEPNNSFVLAAVANARRVLNKNFTQSHELAAMAVRANPANPLAWWSLSAAKLYAGQSEDAHALAVNAQQLAQGSKFKPWADFQRSLTAVVTGRLAEASRFGETAHALAPNFRPPLRYLTAIYAADGDRASVDRVVRKLTNVESDFTIVRMVSDPDYPVSIMRNTGLIEPKHFERLELRS